MKSKFLLVCLPLLWTSAAFVSVNADGLTLTYVSGGLKLDCSENFPEIEDKSIILPYEDKNSRTLTCKGEPIQVKFRTCDNCVELDVVSILGIAIGDVVATVVIGVAVYLIASQARISPTSSLNKSSDRRQLFQNEAISQPSHSHYQQLRHHGQKDTYDTITNRK